jgi:hypothetical protein
MIPCQRLVQMPRHPFDRIRLRDIPGQKVQPQPRMRRRCDSGGSGRSAGRVYGGQRLMWIQFWQSSRARPVCLRRAISRKQFRASEWRVWSLIRGGSTVQCPRFQERMPAAVVSRSHPDQRWFSTGQRTRRRRRHIHEPVVERSDTTGQEDEDVPVHPGRMPASLRGGRCRAGPRNFYGELLLASRRDASVVAQREPRVRSLCSRPGATG